MKELSTEAKAQIYEGERLSCWKQEAEHDTGLDSTRFESISNLSESEHSMSIHQSN